LVFEHLARGLELVEGLPPSTLVGSVLARAARYYTLAGRRSEGRELAERVLQLADELDSPELRAHALNTKGVVLFMGDDVEGLSVLRQAAELADQINSPEAGRAYNNLGIFQFQRGDVVGGMKTLERSRAISAQLGQRAQVRFQDGVLVANKWFIGDWDTAMTI